MSDVNVNEDRIYVKVTETVNPITVTEQSTYVRVEESLTNINVDEVKVIIKPIEVTSNINVSEVKLIIKASTIIATGGSEFPIAIGDIPPSNPEHGDLWLDTN